MNTKNKINVYWNLAIFTVFTVVAFALPELSMAEGESAMNKVLCAATNYVQSDVAKGLAVAAVICLGLAALLGKISWGLGLMVIVGIGLMFGAEDIITKISTGAEGTGCT